MAYVNVTLTKLETAALLTAARSVRDDLDPEMMAYGMDGKAVAAYDRAMIKVQNALNESNRGGS